jgi:hypothetical protein
VLRDPIPLLQAFLQRFLSDPKGRRVELDGIVSRNVPWRPHVLERTLLRGWYLHPVAPLSQSWAERIVLASKRKPQLRVGVAAIEELLADEKFLSVCHELNAAILPLKIKGDNFVAEEVYPSVEDYICSARLKLSGGGAQEILDKTLARALAEKTKHRKGILLELLVAVLLSQVDGFEVADIGIANRSQQMDVLVHNRNAGGALGQSAIVLAEAKNWSAPVDTPEYAAFIRKLQSRHGRARLGYLVTTSRFTAGIAAERRRDSMDQTLVVLIDGRTLPSLWRGIRSITAGIERLTISAAVGT